MVSRLALGVTGHISHAPYGTLPAVVGGGRQPTWRTCHTLSFECWIRAQQRHKQLLAVRLLTSSRTSPFFAYPVWVMYGSPGGYCTRCRACSALCIECLHYGVCFWVVCSLTLLSCATALHQPSMTGCCCLVLAVSGALVPMMALSLASCN